VLRNIFRHKKDNETKGGENYIVRGFIICALCIILP
jgi:hypothetical protein